MTLRPSSFRFTMALAGISALPPLSIDMNLPGVPGIEAAFGLGSGKGALTLSLFLFGFALAPIAGGPVADRFGRRNTLLASLLGTSLGAFGCALAPGFPSLLLCRLVQGAAAGVCLVIPLAIVRDTLQGHAARRQIARIMTIVGLAPLVAPVVGARIFLASGWRAIYAVQALFGVLLFVRMLTGFSETLPPERRLALNPRQVARGYRTVFGNRVFAGFALGNALSFACLFAYISGSPGLLLGELGLSAQAYSWVFAATSAGLLLGSFASGWLGCREVRPRRIVAWALAGMALAAGGALLLTLNGPVRLAALVPLLLTMTFCCGLLGPNAMGEALEPLGRVAGTAAGAVSALQMLLGAGSSALVTFLGAFCGPGVAMTLVMTLAVLLGIAALTAARGGGARGASGREERHAA